MGSDGNKVCIDVSLASEHIDRSRSSRFKCSIMIIVRCPQFLCKDRSCTHSFHISITSEMVLKVSELNFTWNIAIGFWDMSFKGCSTIYTERCQHGGEMDKSGSGVMTAPYFLKLLSVRLQKVF